MVKKGIERLYLIIIFLFLYLPIVVLIVLSFNDSKSRVQWGGFTLRWYQEVFKSRTIMNAFYTTITITLVASIVATLLGTLAAIGIHSMKRRQKFFIILSIRKRSEDLQKREKDFRIIMRESGFLLLED